MNNVIRNLGQDVAVKALGNPHSRRVVLSSSDILLKGFKALHRGIRGAHGIKDQFIKSVKIK